MMISQLDNIIAQVPSGYEWLLRTAGPGRFFANVTTPDFQPTIGGDHTGTSFRAYGNSVEEALQRAIDDAREYHKLGPG